MIGSNVPAASQPIETITGMIGEPYAIRSPLGWLIYGAISDDTQKAVSVHFSKVRSYTSIQSNTENLEELFKEHMNRDFNERSDDEIQPSVEDKQFLQIMEDSIIKVDGHYQTRLPIRDCTQSMPNNYTQARSYAEALKKKLLKDEKLKTDYTEFMESLEECGYAERIPEAEVDRQDGKTWYIPNHNVYNPKKPDKVRVVFNCPATYEGKSLNQRLLQGPDLTNRLTGVLMRWRQEVIAIMADIQSMFYQVRVDPADRDLLRYIWWSGGDISKPPQTYRMCVHVFGAISSPSCANFVLKRTAQDVAEKYGTEVTNAILQDFYVDDLAKSTATEEGAIKLAKEIKGAVSEGGFNLTKWLSNSRKVLESIPMIRPCQRSEESRT